MGRAVYFINAFFGIIVGFLVSIITLILLILKGFNSTWIGLFIAGIISIGFGVYEWKKFRATSQKKIT